MRVGTINFRGVRNDLLLEQARSISSVDVLCVTETWQRSDKVTGHRTNDLSIAGPLRKGSKTQHHGGVRLLASPRCKLRYLSHLRKPFGQAIVASNSCGIVIIGAYISPLHGRATFESILEWIRPWLRGQAILVGDLNARHRHWDTDYNAYGTALKEWSTAIDARVYAPRQVTCSNSTGASTIDLFVSRSPKLAEISVISGTWDDVTDHHLVTATVCPPADRTICRVPARLFSLQSRISATVTHYRETLPEVSLLIEAATTPQQLERAVSSFQAAILKPWREFSRPVAPRFRPGWTQKLDRLATKRSRLLRFARRGDEIARMEANILDRNIKRLQRARKRALEKAANESATALQTQPLQPPFMKL